MGQAEPELQQPSDRSLPNWKLPTLGGKQLWTDFRWRQGWKLQQHALTGHWRLVDDKNVRQAWGSKNACLETLDRDLPAIKIEGTEIVVVLHGLGRSSTSMMGLGTAIHQDTDVQLVYFEYASTRASIGEHAAALQQVIAGLPDDTPLNFVGHSMGNIIVRHAINDWQESGDQAVLDRIQRVVMLGPPNQGSALARLLSRWRLFGLMLGEGGLQLGPEWDSFVQRLATPSCPFGIIAGSGPQRLPDNPLLNSDNDLVVSVEETKLDGAADFLEVPCVHTFLMDDPAVQRAVVRFLETARF